MRASVGDMLRVHSRTISTHEQQAEIIEVRGERGEPPFLVRFPDGHESLIFPGPDCTVEEHHVT
ncbi:DUF1918 domain-containing protein [Goodfellowiella coeruleoviolacea]|uniref:DUF1918 domain-containing protein n=1 Tax=Goodfellowiella coeruleoviolacea TaxID=334858 RepID=A0AAE3GG30_9PSEU|nr:DUF1918 domain-containing protein [Goodfellowiella coeruleoviolacea]MCP2165493.1 protein of unknown function (DUF1918) [Goodfellowiella coeruleoviolacea]